MPKDVKVRSRPTRKTAQDRRIEQQKKLLDNLRYTELRDAILELLPANSPARHPETGVSVVDELSDMKRDLSNLVKFLRADRDEVVSESRRVMLALEMAERWLS